MPRDFYARCSDCGYDWYDFWWAEGLYTRADAPKATFSCPQCFVTFSVPTDYFEGITPERWLSSHEREIAANSWIARLAELVQSVPRESPYLSTSDRLSLDYVPAPSASMRLLMDTSSLGRSFAPSASRGMRGSMGAATSCRSCSESWNDAGTGALDATP